MQNWLKTQKISEGIKKKLVETLEPMRWSREGLRWKVILVSFVYIWSTCAFFPKSPFSFDYPRTLLVHWFERMYRHLHKKSLLKIHTQQWNKKTRYSEKNTSPTATAPQDIAAQDYI
jgi:hypothetical protein